MNSLASDNDNSIEPLTPTNLDEAQDMMNNNLEPNFQKLNYVNKINILLKALIIERNKN